MVGLVSIFGHPTGFAVKYKMTDRQKIVTLRDSEREKEK